MSLIPIYSTVAVAPAEISNTASSGTDDNLTAYTFSSVAFGAAATDRQIIVGAGGGGTGAPRTVSSVTIGGVSASLVIAEQWSPGTEHNLELWEADVPTGTSGDIVVTWSGAMGGCGIGVFRVVGAASGYSSRSSAELSAGTGVAVSTTMNVPVKGVLLAVSAHNETRTSVWVGVTEDFDSITRDSDWHMSGGSLQLPAGETGRTISSTPSGHVAASLLVTASYGPA